MLNCCIASSSLQYYTLGYVIPFVRLGAKLVIRINLSPLFSFGEIEVISRITWPLLTLTRKFSYRFSSRFFFFLFFSIVPSTHERRNPMPAPRAIIKQILHRPRLFPWVIRFPCETYTSVWPLIPVSNVKGIVTAGFLVDFRRIFSRRCILSTYRHCAWLTESF